MVKAGLTARTRNSDVFPAFCSPIMVMSISVALSASSNPSTSFEAQHDQAAFGHSSCRLSDETVITAHGAHNKKTTVKDLPKQPQKPVIHLFEYAGHVAKKSIAI